MPKFLIKLRKIGIKLWWNW